MRRYKLCNDVSGISKSEVKNYVNKMEMHQSGAYPGIGQGGGTSDNFLLGLLKCRFLYL